MIPDNIESDLKRGVEQLLKMASTLCWNKISNNCFFIISEIKEEGSPYLLDKYIIRKQQNDEKIPKSLANIAHDLRNIYQKLYDVNLFIYKAEKRKTIVEIRYYPKSSLEKDYFLMVKDNLPMWHSKLTLPPYHQDKKSKFDINWELGGFRHQWKLFWWKKKIKNISKT